MALPQKQINFCPSNLSPAWEKPAERSLFQRISSFWITPNQALYRALEAEDTNGAIIALEDGANPSIIDYHLYRITANGNEELLRALLPHVHDPQELSESLNNAARYGLNSIVCYLIADRGVTPTETTLYAAAFQGHEDIVNYLVSITPEYLPLAIEQSTANPFFLRQLLVCSDHNLGYVNTAFIEAAKNGHIESLEMLLEIYPISQTTINQAFIEAINANNKESIDFLSLQTTIFPEEEKHVRVLNNLGFIPSPLTDTFISSLSEAQKATVFKVLLKEGPLSEEQITFISKYVPNFEPSLQKDFLQNVILHQSSRESIDIMVVSALVKLPAKDQVFLIKKALKRNYSSEFFQTWKQKSGLSAREIPSREIIRLNTEREARIKQLKKMKEAGNTPRPTPEEIQKQISKAVLENEAEILRVYNLPKDAELPKGVTKHTSHDRVVEFDSMPNLIFKMLPNRGLSSTRAKHQKMDQARQIIKEKGLDLLHVPQAQNIQYLGGQPVCLIVEEKMRLAIDDFDEHMELLTTDTTLHGEMMRAYEQAFQLIHLMGIWDVKYNNLSIMKDRCGIAVIDVDSAGGGSSEGIGNLARKMTPTAFFPSIKACLKRLSQQIIRPYQLNQYLGDARKRQERLHNKLYN